MSMAFRVVMEYNQIEQYGIAMTKDLERSVSAMCNLSKGVWEDGVQQGIQQGVLDTIVKLMKNLGFTIEQAMSALEISDDKKPEYEEMLKKTK